MTTFCFRSGIRFPDVKLLLDVQARFVGEMLRLWEQVPEEGLALFSHGHPIKLAIAYFAGVLLDLFSRFEIRPASVSTITVGEYLLNGEKTGPRHVAQQNFDML